MGGRGGRHQGRRNAAGLARRHDRRRLRLLRCGVFRPRSPRHRRERRRQLARRRRAGRRHGAVQGAPLGDHDPRPRLSRRDARGVAVRGAGAPRRGVGRRRGAARCRRRDLCRPWHRLRSRAARVSARAYRKLDFRRRPPHPARPDRRPARARRARSPPSRRRQRARSRRRSTTSARARFAPISPACGTRPNIRGCSGRKHHSRTGAFICRRSARRPALAVRPVSCRHRGPAGGPTWSGPAPRW